MYSQFGVGPPLHFCGTSSIPLWLLWCAPVPPLLYLLYLSCSFYVPLLFLPTAFQLGTLRRSQDVLSRPAPVPLLFPLALYNNNYMYLAKQPSPDWIFLRKAFMVKYFTMQSGTSSNIMLSSLEYSISLSTQVALHPCLPKLAAFCFEVAEDLYIVCGMCKQTVDLQYL